MTTADLVIHNGRVLTMDADNPRAEAVAIANGRILGVGTSADMTALSDHSTKVIDAGGGSVLPGFIESHMHLFCGAAEMGHLQLGHVHGLEALTLAIRSYAASHSNQKFLFAQGCDYEVLGPGRPLDRHVLDSILSDQAILAVAADHHTAWANTAALEWSGILNGRELPHGHEIVMGEDGKATGLLLEMEAFGPILSAGEFDRYRLGLATGAEPAPYPDPQTFRADMDVMRTGMAYCARHGITSLHNMDGNFYQLELLAAIEKEDGFLSCRTRIPFHYKPHMPLSLLEKASDMKKACQSDFLAGGVVKIFYDGVIDSHTAFMVDDYADRPGERGSPLLSEDHFTQVAIKADRLGLQIAVHAVGDGAVRGVLNGYEAAQKANGRRDSRHRIEHIEVVRAGDLHRFHMLGVIASMQPSHAPGAMDFAAEPTISMIGRQRWPLSYAWRSLKDAGARIPFASDWPVSDINVLRSIQAATTRRKWAESDPDQRFTLIEALEAYTIEGAHAEFADDVKGRIKPDFLGDLVILSGDIENTPLEKLHELRPKTTICGGRVTYCEQGMPA